MKTKIAGKWAKILDQKLERNQNYNLTKNEIAMENNQCTFKTVNVIFSYSFNQQYSLVQSTINF